MARLPFGMDEYHMIGGDIHTAIHQVPEGDDATAKGFFNWLAGPVKKALHGVMGRKKLESLITLNRSGCAFAIASWKKLTSDMTRLRIPFPPQDVPSHRATLNELFLMTVPLPTDFDEDTKAKLKEMLEYNVRLIQEIPELIIVDVAQALQWLKGEFDARVVGLRSAARSGKHEGRQEAVAKTVDQAAQDITAKVIKQMVDGADTQTPQKSDQPDEKISTATRRPLKPPTKLETEIALYYETTGLIQADVAKKLNKSIGNRLKKAGRSSLTQVKVSNIITKVNRFRRASGLPEIETRAKVKADSVAPNVIDMGKRTHKGTGLRQTGRRKQRGEDK